MKSKLIINIKTTWIPNTCPIECTWKKQDLLKDKQIMSLTSQKLTEFILNGVLLHNPTLPWTHYVAWVGLDIAMWPLLVSKSYDFPQLSFCDADIKDMGHHNCRQTVYLLF